MLKMFLDAACTTEFFAHQAFAGNGAATAFLLSAFTGPQLGSVYKETKVTTAGVTFAAGVGSGFSGLTVNALIGQRVVHNGLFRGTVTANTATTVTISDTGYTQATASACVVSAYVKLTLNTDYTLASNTITTLFVPTSAQAIIASPASDLSANFGGTAGTVKTSQAAFWLRRSPITGGGSLNTYDTLQVQSLDLSVADGSLTQSAVTFVDGVGSGFSGLVAGALIGRAVNHNGTFRGTVTANTATTVTISDLAYDGDSADAVVYTVGSLQFAPDVAGNPGTYAPVIHPAAINNDTAVKLWVKDTITVPASAINYPNNVIAVTGIEYLA